MNKYIKLLTCIILFIFSKTTFGQIENQIHFYGYQLSKYDKPVLVRQNEYKPYYKFFEKREQGRIILDEETKTFSIKWRSGEDWTANIIKKEQKSETQEMVGRVLKTTYSGIWLDDNVKCDLIMMETYEGKCLIILKTGKVVDDYYNIDDWKNIFNFVTGNECLNEIQIDTQQKQIKKNSTNLKNPQALYKGRKSLNQKEN